MRQSRNDEPGAWKRRARPKGRRGGRHARRGERREAILAAALEEFSARGFAATRLDDVAQRAGVAKGTIYLYFRDKESLFQELVRAMLSPLVGVIEAAPLRDLPIRAVAEMIIDVFVNEIYGTRRKDVIRLILAEGPRFPKIAEFYYREVIGRVLPVMRALLTRAVERGELGHDALARFPQLLVAPALVAVMWSGLFDRFEPLDVRANDASASRAAVRGKERGMKSGRIFLVSLLTLATAFVAGCNNAKEPTFQGWMEAELIFVGPDETGRIETLSVREGDHVEQRSPLFTLDPDLQLADVAMQEAAVKNAQIAFDRAKELLRTQSGTQRAFDDAEAALRTAQARLNSAQTRLTRRKMFSPVTGSVQQIYYRAGELVPAGKPIVALLPPANLKVRFFVPEAMLPKLSIGEPVTISCDGCDKGLTAKISFIARSSEFTPPVIYSMEERSKLVFLIEARPERPERLRVGQPVSVTLGQEQ